jgi:enoyl-CoA hydratase
VSRSSDHDAALAEAGACDGSKALVMTAQKNSEENVLLDVTGEIATITLNRPERLNCLTPAAYGLLADCVTEASSNSQVGVIVIRGAGRAFCTGGDLSLIRETLTRDGGLDNLDLTRELAVNSRRAFTSLEASPKTVIASVHGHCHAGGLAVALCADLVISAEAASFRVPEGLVGLADPYVPVRLARRAGLGFAKVMLYTAEAVGARDALAHGVVDFVVPDDELAAETARLAAQVGKTSAYSRMLYKETLVADLPAFDRSIYLRAHMGPDAREGTRAFLERRKPSWQPDPDS